MTDKEIEDELRGELRKSLFNSGKDMIREANTLPLEEKVAKPEQNLDIIKHLIKRVDLHQINSLEKTKTTNGLLFVISFLTFLVAALTYIK